MDSILHSIMIYNESNIGNYKPFTIEDMIKILNRFKNEKIKDTIISIDDPSGQILSAYTEFNIQKNKYNLVFSSKTPLDLFYHLQKIKKDTDKSYKLI